MTSVIEVKMADPPISTMTSVAVSWLMQNPDSAYLYYGVWQCEWCGSVNPRERTACSQCGGPRLFCMREQPERSTD